MIKLMRQVAGRHADLVLVVLLIGILVVLFAPIPASLLDFLIIANFSFALLILLLTFYMEKPVDFSTFPSLLLVATLFRLSLNIAATRLILSSADAGRVIGAIGSFVVSGNYVIGLIVFLILVVVQYVVVTAGAQRVAEVAARFTLDSMPGQQMSIDADLNMGFIDQVEAQRRRRNIEKEANFYGSMDGASKFVKGDAIAGIIILLIDIIGGLAVGVAQMGMPWHEALQTFTLLTIGDGIVTQIPALIISVGTGIIVTRSAADTHLGKEALMQITRFPKTLFIVMAALVVMALLPGLPLLPIILLLPIFGGLALFSMKDTDGALDAEKTATSKNVVEEEGIEDQLVVQPIEIEVGQGLVSLAAGEDSQLMERIVAFRKQYALESGFVLPRVRVRDNKKLDPNKYVLSIYGTPVGEAVVFLDRVMAIHPGGERRKLPGIETKDPTYGLAAVWITNDQRQEARTANYTLVDPLTVFTTHLSEVLKKNAASLLTRAETEKMIERARKQQSGLVEELIPNILSLSEVQKVLQNLLREKVSIRNLEAILEVLVDAGRSSKEPDQLTELVRQRLAPVICRALLSSSQELHVLTLDPAIEQSIANSLRTVDSKSHLVLEPRFAEQMLTRLAMQVEKMVKSNMMPVLLCAPELRRHLRRITERVLPHLAVVSMAEVSHNTDLKSFGVVTL
ncbi:MAG: flagellar biosynthesis protein FlhA [Pseudomonadota bacterium]